MGFSIGELSRRTEVKVPTIRYYEQIGLLDAPPRTEGGQRRYGKSEAARVNFIRHARALGFEIDAIRELLDLSGAPERSCDAVDVIARRHLAAIEERMERLGAMRDELTRMIEACGHGKVCACRVIQVLADHSLCEHPQH